MRAIVVREFGHYKDVAKLETLPNPEPGPDDVIVRNKAAGVSFAASLNIAGKYQRKAPLPYIPAPEAAGIVHAVGKNITRVKVGDHVMCSVDDSGAAGFSKIPEVSCFVIPKDMDFGVGSAIITSYNTSYGALTAGPTCRPGKPCWCMVRPVPSAWPLSRSARPWAPLSLPLQAGKSIVRPPSAMARIMLSTIAGKNSAMSSWISPMARASMWSMTASAAM